MRYGYPPKPLSADDVTLISAVLKHGDLVLVQKNGSAPGQSSAAKQTSESESSPKPRPYDLESRKTIPESSILSQGTLTMRVVPDDNSCLFRSVNGVLGQRNASAHRLRQVVCQTVARQPDLYSEAFLGRSNAAYQKWIMTENAWGGAIELSILSNHFKIELAAFDVKTMRLDRYGEGNSYPTVGYLMYDGIHYNYVALALGVGLGLDTDVTQFDVNDRTVQKEVRELGRKEHNSKNFTDTANFTLKCGQCGMKLEGEAQALEHAKKTGHQSFSEN